MQRLYPVNDVVVNDVVVKYVDDVECINLFWEKVLIYGRR